MKSFNYICLSCGSEILIEYYKDGDWTTIHDQCPKCKTLIDRRRINDIVHDKLNPPQTPLNPTQEYYEERKTQEEKEE